jgi:hypothetical protein
MNSEWQWWALILGVLLGAGGYWLVRERLPRQDGDLELDERATEAAWISRQVNAMGGDAPPEVVGLVLELHREYLAERVPPREHFDEGAPDPAPPHSQVVDRDLAVSE